MVYMVKWYFSPNSVHVYQDAYQDEIKAAKYEGQSYEVMICIAYTKMWLFKYTLTAIRLMARLCICKGDMYLCILVERYEHV